jgi:hypothetical protein
MLILIVIALVLACIFLAVTYFCSFWLSRHLVPGMVGLPLISWIFLGTGFLAYALHEKYMGLIVVSVVAFAFAFGVHPNSCPGRIGCCNQRCSPSPVCVQMCMFMCPPCMYVCMYVYMCVCECLLISDGHVLALRAAAIRLEFFSVGGCHAEFD